MEHIHGRDTLLSGNRPIMSGLHLVVALACLCVGFLANRIWPDLAGGFAITATSVLLAIVTTAWCQRSWPTLLVTSIAIVAVFLPELETPVPLSTIPIAKWTVLTVLLLTAFGLVAQRMDARLSLTELAAAYADSPTAHILLDMKGNVQSTNDAFLRLFKLPTTMIGRLSMVDVLPDALMTHFENLRDLRINGEPQHVACDLTLHDGSSAWVSLYAVRLNPELVLVQFIDLTLAITNKQELTVSKLRFDSVFQQADAMNFILDNEGRLLEFNQYARKRFGAVLDAVVGHPLEPLVNKSDRSSFSTSLGSIVCGDAPVCSIDQCQLDFANVQTFVEVKMSFLPKATATGDGVLLTCREIADKLHSLRQLQLSEARFSRIFHASPDGIAIIRQVDGTIIDFNNGFTELLGYSREDAIGEKEHELKIWHSAEDRSHTMAILAETGEFVNKDAMLRTNTGDVVHTSLSLRYIEVDGDICIFAMARDITARVLAESALAESQEKFAQVFSRSPEGIALLDARTNTIEEMNEAFLVTSGYERSEVLGKRIDELAAFADSKQMQLITDQIKSRGEFQNLEIHFQTKTGEVIPTLSSGTLIQLKDRTCILCIVKNVAEERRTEARLRASEERFRSAFENAPIGMLLVDRQGRVSQVNRFAADLLAYDDGQIAGMHISRLVPRDERPSLKDLLNKLDREGEETAECELRMLCSNGMEPWTNFHMVVQRDQDHSPSSYIVQITDITQAKLSQQRMEKLAFYDTLTNLANRRLFNERLKQCVDQAERNATLSALLYLDLDQFKRVNDTLGHDAGDELLRQVSARLLSCVRKEDTVSRPGGDEFTILLNNIASSADAGIVAEKILRRLREPVMLSDHHLVVTTSIGITIIPTDGKEPALLTKNADLAMYKAKERGRNNYQFFCEEMNTDTLLRLRTEYELRRALDRGEFLLFYQPKIRLTDQSVVGVECLLRWQHPDRGLLSPELFIDVAEETGAILDIGTWIIGEACRAGRQLTEHMGRTIDIAINISPAQFRDPMLMQTIQQHIRETGLEPSQVEIEITETMLMHDVDAASATIQQMHELGIKLAIDDFGTGYSSLHYLKKFPIDTIKVDRSFVMDIPTNPDDMAITAAVIAMAHELNLEVVAEGVETPAQLDFLRAQKCDLVQGYLISKPVTLDQLQSTLVADNRVIPIIAPRAIDTL